MELNFFFLDPTRKTLKSSVVESTIECTQLRGVDFSSKMLQYSTRRYFLWRVPGPEVLLRLPATPY